MELLGPLAANLLSPMVLACALGIVAALVRSDLRIPEPIYAILAVYLLLAIGMKGGARLAETPLAEFVWPLLATLALGVVTPLLSYAVLRLVKMPVVDAAAIAAHFGSVSAVTFSAALMFMESRESPAEGFMPALVVVLEIPAILIGILIARLALRKKQADAGGVGKVMHEVFAGKGVVLLMGGLLIGLIAGRSGMEQVGPVFVDPFTGVLTLFLLEMGLVIGRRLRELGRQHLILVAFGTVMPLVHGFLGALAGTLAGLSIGGTMVLATMAASASYIAAPAAVRIALPQADPGIYLTASLVITFPFNLAIGLPVYELFARMLHGG